jgi:hypothetical protein
MVLLSMDESKEMSETQPTAPAVDTGGTLSASMQEGGAQLPEPNPIALLQIDVSPTYLKFPHALVTGSQEHNAKLDTAKR